MTDASSNRTPTHRLYIVRDGETARWIEIGAAWANKDGNGFSLTLTASPASGRLVMRAVADGGQQ